ncbi:hypothetical protein [Bathymodiolus platifrons methanotrophic gill symbiont]|uniref:hypothetical protein n=1 Tax=Bathymodiolus platifrons methanotrophic gill symbiont TaxID=113268 RepID=UPI001C8ECFE5|nr:hypothetical protein [Bathymodiolus platifrons methanotrophic gill symbiont]
MARTQDVWGAEGISGRVKFLPLAWAGMPKTSFRKNSDSPQFQLQAGGKYVLGSSCGFKKTEVWLDWFSSQKNPHCTAVFGKINWFSKSWFRILFFS